MEDVGVNPWRIKKC